MFSNFGAIVSSEGFDNDGEVVAWYVGKMFAVGV
jgi:hypothetical protein